MSEVPPVWANASEFHYRREGMRLELTMRGLTNHEAREILVGLWLRLKPEDRAEHIAELQHYSEPDAQPSTLAQHLRDAK